MRNAATAIVAGLVSAVVVAGVFLAAGVGDDDNDGPDPASAASPQTFLS